LGTAANGQERLVKIPNALTWKRKPAGVAFTQRSTASRRGMA